MLRKRYNQSTISSSKEALMADYGEKRRSIFTPNTRLFTGFTTPKGVVVTDSESLMSPTSILDSNKPFSAFKNPFWSDPYPITPRNPKSENNKIQFGVVGLGLIDVLTNEKSHDYSNSKLSKPISPMVFFGSQLKIQVPPVDNSSNSPVDFGIKTKNCTQMGSISPSNSSEVESSNSPRDFTSLSISEMELSEEYTCVVYHGPNPKTTHIFDDCVVESCYGDHLGGAYSSSSSSKENVFLIESSSHPIMMSYPSSSENFLSFCYNCKRNLCQGKDIYMYRGEKAFCSIDCRYKEMMREEEGMEITEEEESDDLEINLFP